MTNDKAQRRKASSQQSVVGIHNSPGPSYLKRGKTWEIATGFALATTSSDCHVVPISSGLLAMTRGVKGEEIASAREGGPRNDRGSRSVSTSGWRLVSLAEEWGLSIKNSRDTMKLTVATAFSE